MVLLVSMSVVRIRLPDNSIKEFPERPTVLNVAESISPRLAKDTLGGVVNGKIVDLRRQLKDGDELKVVTSKHEEAVEIIRHSAAHVMAQAVQEIWPDIKVTIGPVTETGFFYDFDAPFSFKPEDLTKIESQMNKIIKEKLEIARTDYNVEEAKQIFSDIKEEYKIEIINDLVRDENVETVGIYRQGKWFDLCRGPHVQHTGQIGVIKVLNVAGAYWRGDEKRNQLQRIYGTAFLDKKELKKYLFRLEEAKKRDHRKIGKELNLFYFSELSPGCPIFTGKGAVIYNELVNYIRELYHKYKYEEVITPQIYDVDLYHKSGHYENFKENMYFIEEEHRDYSLKPMNCPSHCILYSQKQYSYRDLPLRIADFGRLHRLERSGALHGITRVRMMCQDDAHVFCSLEQIEEEVRNFFDLLNEVYSTLGMTNYKVFFATRPKKRVGDDAIWDQSEASLQKALKTLNVDYGILPEEGAFYGPKLEFHFLDAIERSWQLGTIQLDFSMPDRFSLKYIGDDNKEHVPVMLHRAILGSLERFIGVYIEHTSGKLPTWLSPVQVKILNVSDRVNVYCEKIENLFRASGVRAYFDSRNEKLGYKIREAQLQKVPYMIIIGDEEKNANTLSIRNREGQQTSNLEIENTLKLLKKEIQLRSLELSL